MSSRRSSPFVRLMELVDMMTERKIESASGEEAQGRQSGSIAWRLARGEVGDGSSTLQKTVWVPTTTEKESLTFRVEYDVVSNVYTRSSNNDEVVHGWENGVSEAKAVFRKEEHDWGQIYLARTGKQFPAEVRHIPKSVR